MNKIARIFLLLSLLTIWEEGIVCAQFKGEKLPVTVNSEYDELSPGLSPDGNTLYFVRSLHPSNLGFPAADQDIWYSHRTGNTWGPAQNLGRPVNNSRFNYLGGISENGNTLVLGNLYDDTLSVSPGISISKWEEGVLTQPDQFLSGKDFLKNGFSGFFCSRDLNTILLSGADKKGKKEDLFVIFREGSTWTIPLNLGSIINSESYECAPWLNKEGTLLFFASDREGGFGDADIYMSRRLDETWTNWSMPENLGESVNTAGFDGYFMIDETADLAYFVSGDTPEEMGDIYTLQLAEIPALAPLETIRVSFVTQQNNPYLGDLGELNGELEDYVIISGAVRSTQNGNLELSASSSLTFLYTPKKNFTGMDEGSLQICPKSGLGLCRTLIMEIEVVEPDFFGDLPAENHLPESVAAENSGTRPSINNSYHIAGSVKDADSGLPLSSMITAKEGRFSIGNTLSDDIRGEYHLDLPPGNGFSLFVFSPGYLPVIENLRPSDFKAGNPLIYDFALQKIESGKDLAMKKVVFESNEATLVPESYADLDLLSALMRQNPGMEVELRSYTDSDGSASYNQKLSQERVTSAIGYLVNTGIEIHRLKGRGMGESNPIASNDTPEGKAKNRRIEFIVLTLGDPGK